MPTLKELRTRINSVTSTRQTTAAMKMVSAAKLHKAQDRILRLRPYAAAMEAMMARAAGPAKDIDSPYTVRREVSRVLMVVITSDKGLCGALNSNTVKHALHVAETQFAPQMHAGQVDFLAFGEKGKALLRKRNVTLVEDMPSLHEPFDAAATAPVADRLMQDFAAARYDKVVFVYHKFKNAATQVVTDECFLPALQEEADGTEEHAETDYIFEPDRSSILSTLIPSMLRLRCYCIFSEAAASEHGIRMTSMHQATDNADRLIGELSLQYNKARQAAITNQLVEIVSSTEAQQ